METNVAPADFDQCWQKKHLEIMPEGKKVKFKNPHEKILAESLDKMGVIWTYEPLIVMPKNKELRNRKKGIYYRELRPDCVFLRPYMFMTDQGVNMITHGFELKKTQANSITIRKIHVLLKLYRIRIIIVTHQELHHWLNNGGIPLTNYR